jgi:hypothetical protein
MDDGEIKEFVSKSIEQIKAGLPEGCSIEGKFDFEVSLITSKEANGKIDIHLVNLGANSQAQQVHKIRFSIVDDQAQKKNMKLAANMMQTIFQQMASLEQQSSQLEYGKLKQVKK